MKELTNSRKIALYGLGTETERFINEKGETLKVIGLLDGFKDSGELFGYPIISLKQAIEAGVELIIVVARPGSCKVIAKRIKEDCLANNIKVFDVRGNDLLVEQQVKYDFRGINVYTKNDLLQKIDEADVVSFDLFDTLISRKIFYYADLFEMGLPAGRLAVEIELSKDYAPRLAEIYERIDGQNKEKLAQKEWELDSNTFIPREGMKEILEYVKSKNKTLILTSDSYYSKDQIVSVLDRLELNLFDVVFVSCEYGKSKANGLFSIVKEKHPNKEILHIGDDEYVDVEKAVENGIESFRIYAAKDIYEAIGSLGVSQDSNSFADRTKIGLVISRLFSNPFLFEDESLQIQVKDAKDIGYALCGPMVMDFVIWLNEYVKKNGIENVLLCARDGYLIDKIVSSKNMVYFLTSRTSAIRAGIKNQSDIDYVDSMKFFGSQAESLLTRFGIVLEDGEDRNKAILEKAAVQRENYQKYISRLGLGDGKTAVFDFVAKGTTQLFLRNIMSQELVGAYFLQLEPEFMADKGMKIDSFYTEAERDKSVIFDCYYILETILTSPMPSVDEFDSNGQPIYAKETRSKSNLECVERMQQGILEFVEDYLSIVPEEKRTINKQLNEVLLSLIGKIIISDSQFKELVVEDPFFGRMTRITDVL
jgi:predicted HAD superfamily hydrolase